MSFGPSVRSAFVKSGEMEHWGYRKYGDTLICLKCASASLWQDMSVGRSFVQIRDSLSLSIFLFSPRTHRWLQQSDFTSICRSVIRSIGNYFSKIFGQVYSLVNSHACTPTQSYIHPLTQASTHIQANALKCTHKCIFMSHLNDRDWQYQFTIKSPLFLSSTALFASWLYTWHKSNLVGQKITKNQPTGWSNSKLMDRRTSTVTTKMFT